MFTKIAVAVDESACSKEALKVALALAEREHAQLAVCSVVDPIDVAGSAPPSPAMDSVIGEMEVRAKQLVSEAIGRARSRGLQAEGEMRLGAPPKQILEFVKRSGADAVVMGTHGRRGLPHILIGSVAEGVLRESPVPVIAVRDRNGHAKHR